MFCALSNICSITLLNNNSYEGMLEPQSRKEFESKEEEQKYLTVLNEHMLTMVIGKTTQEPNLPVIASSQEWALQKVKEGYFPPRKEPYLRFKNIGELQHQLEQDKIKYDRKDLTFKVRQNNFSIFVFCRNCRSSSLEEGKKKISLKFKPEEENFILKYFDNQHAHHYHQAMRLKRKGDGVFKSIVRQFQNAPRDMNLQQFLSTMSKKYNTKQRNIKHNLYIYRRQIQNFKQIKELATLVDSSFWFKNQITDERYYCTQEVDLLKGEPQLFIFILNDMFERFKEVGDVTFVMILEFEIHGEDSRKWKAIALSGLTLEYLMEPFAFAYVSLEHMNFTVITDVLGFIFQTFNKKPKIMITPSDTFYDSLIKTLKDKSFFLGHHFYDPIMEIDRISNDIGNQDGLSFFENILLSRTKAEYKANIQKLFKECKPTPAIRYHLSRVLKISHRICFSCIETTQFIGSTFDYSGNKIVKDVLRDGMSKKGKLYLDEEVEKEIVDGQHLRHKNIDNPLSKVILQGNDSSFAHVKYQQLKFTHCVKLMMNIMRKEISHIDNVSSYDNRPYETMIDISEIQAIRRNIKMNLFIIFGEQYGKIFHLDYSERTEKENNQGQLKVFDIYDPFDKSIFVVAPEAVYNSDTSFERIRVRCNCLFSLKCGVPCAHQILTTILTKSSLLELFKEDFKVGQRYKKTGKPRHTLKRLQK